MKRCLTSFTTRSEPAASASGFEYLRLSPRGKGEPRAPSSGSSLALTSPQNREDGSSQFHSISNMLRLKLFSLVTATFLGLYILDVQRRARYAAALHRPLHCSDASLTGGLRKHVLRSVEVAVPEEVSDLSRTRRLLKSLVLRILLCGGAAI
jgi:hypothetical protein